MANALTGRRGAPSAVPLASSRNLDSSRRTQHLISEILELLRELSYEAQRQTASIAELQAKVAALEGKASEGRPAEPETEGYPQPVGLAVFRTHSPPRG
jgi:hypothetical protein